MGTCPRATGRATWPASFCDNLRLLDSTPVPCGQSRETARRSELAGHAGYGWCRSHSRYFWGFRLYLLCAPDGMPIAFELAAANVPERVVATEMLGRMQLDHYTVIADKGFAGEEFEQIMAGLGARFLRPDRKDEPRRYGSLGAMRQWIESVFWTCKGQLTLEAHGGRTIEGLCTRVPSDPGVEFGVRCAGDGWRRVEGRTGV
ncbi:MAG: transposase [Actinobacteria bacterium]|nr:transposase [Actinomycetota bacterium]